jgi:hypothetical protein
VSGLGRVELCLRGALQVLLASVREVVDPLACEARCMILDLDLVTVPVHSSRLIPCLFSKRHRIFISYAVKT